MKKVLILCLVVLTACHSKPLVPFTILKSEKTKDGAKMDVQLNGRISKDKMVEIAAYIKSDSSQYDNLQIDYLLPGNNYKNAGGILVYATAAYHGKTVVAPADTVKDNDNNLLSFEFIGFTPEKVKQLFAFNPADMVDKHVLGKFIDDNTRTITILYQDKKEGNQTYILELDTVGKVVSAIAPMEVTLKGIRKMVVSHGGDYMVLKDSILTMYSSEEGEKPYRSIKAGI